MSQLSKRVPSRFHSPECWIGETADQGNARSNRFDRDRTAAASIQTRASGTATISHPTRYALIGLWSNRLMSHGGADAQSRHRLCRALKYGLSLPDTHQGAGSAARQPDGFPVADSNL